jgi:DNA helicase-2/ATP-dependent DNA helicase PcrA
MMESNNPLDDNMIDNHVDEEIADCLRLENPKSFFLFAGAGSGKTRSLVTVLNRICSEQGNDLRVKGKKVAVITFTNAACDEIQRRLNFNPLVDVSTIHSFVWDLIQGYNLDIKSWVTGTLKQDLIDLEDAQAKGRAGKAQQDRARSILEKTKKLEGLPSIKRFTYNPNGDNRGKASLTHADVIQIGSNFLLNKPLMRSILINRYPILLIDESQDTNKDLMEAVFYVQSENLNKFSVGLLGDTMQRIYSDGKSDLGQKLPIDWVTPAKVMNHRCPKRVVTLINKNRADIDGQ